MKSIYVSGALTGHPGFRAFLEEVSLVFCARGYHVHRFVSSDAAQNPELNVFLHDEAQIQKSDIVVMFCDYPSTGLGLEMMIAKANNKKIFFLYKNSSDISLMVKGFIKLSDYPVITYSNSEPLTSIVDRIIAVIDSEKAP